MSALLHLREVYEQIHSDQNRLLEVLKQQKECMKFLGDYIDKKHWLAAADQLHQLDRLESNEKLLTARLAINKEWISTVKNNSPSLESD